MTHYYSFDTEYGMRDELFRAILSLDKPLVEQLKNRGVTLTEDVKRVLVRGGGGPYYSSDPAVRLWYQYIRDIKNTANESLIWISRRLFEETKAPLYCTRAFEWQVITGRTLDNAMLACLFECYDFKKLKKTRILHNMIIDDNTTFLSFCAEQGWLKKPSVRDEMIQYATENGKRNCLAWLLDYKNRNFDIAAERAGAEKKAERELNAAPNSVTALKAIWRFRKREDDTIIITKYLGESTEITVPERIGKHPVTAIGRFAFSPEDNLLYGLAKNKSTITGIKLPNGIQSIGKGAFSGCQKLERIDIPDSVKEMGGFIFAGCFALRSIKLPEGCTEISDYMFMDCEALDKITIPASVVKIGKWAFTGCNSLEEIVIPDGVEEIKRQAFMFCDSLKTVVLPASVKRIANIKQRGLALQTIFRDCPNVTAVVKPKSYAEKYCKRNRINYKYTEEEK